MSIEEINQTAISIFPNPAKDQIQIQAEKEVLDYELIDASGKSILRESNNTINLIGLDTGIYFVQVRFKDGMNSRQRFIKQ